MHHQIFISEFPGSYLLATDRQPVETAVVFVHGFLGDSFTTWIDFQGLIDTEASWEHVDFYFLDYDSFRESIGASTHLLLRLLERIEQAPADWFEAPVASPPSLLSLNTVRLRSEATEYRDLVLVGHSLGAVLIREAILHHAGKYVALVSDTEDTGSVAVPQILRAALRFFAPAISGAREAGLLGGAMRVFGIGGFTRALLGLSPSYAELKPGETGLIVSLQTRTEELAERFPRFQAFRADILWAERDNVIVDRKYFLDRERGRAQGTNHMSVCKPRPGYRQPIDLVSRGQI